jgi:hypothetical protein
VASIPAPSRNDLSGMAPEHEPAPRWLLLMRAADAEFAAAQRYWRETYQKPTPQSIASQAIEDAIRTKHAGGRT